MECDYVNQRGDAGNRACSPRFVFLAGVVQTSANLTDIRRPEHALKLFLRSAISKGVVTYGLELMTAIFQYVCGWKKRTMRISIMAPHLIYPYGYKMKSAE